MSTDVFFTYDLRCCALSQPESQLDSRSFVKLFKDCQVRDKRCTTTDLDLIFTKACSSY